MNFFKDIRKSYIITSLIYIMIGLVMAFWPEQIGVGLCYVLGALASVYGVVRAVMYFTKPSDDIFRNDLAIGLIVLASGIFILVRPDFVLNILQYLLAVLIVIDSVIKLQRAVTLCKLQYPYWWCVLILAILTLAFGIVLLCDPFQTRNLLMTLIGVGLIVDGIGDLWAITLLTKRIKDHFPVSRVE